MTSITRRFYSVFICAAALVGLVVVVATPLASKTYLTILPLVFIAGCLVAARATGVFAGENLLIRRMLKIAPVYPLCAAALVALELVRHPGASWPFVIGLYLAAGVIVIPGTALMTAFFGGPEKA